MHSTNPDQVSLSSLLCEEDTHFGSCLIQGFGDEELAIESSWASCCSDEDEYVQILLQRECVSEKCRISNVPTRLRNVAIDYVFNMRASFGFRFQTAYLSLSYFDLFLSKRSIDNENTWAIQLLSVACLSLAAKLEEERVPSLSEFQVGEYSFGNKLIQRMELLVLNTLEWKMGTVTPFAYLPYFINKFSDGPPPTGLTSRIISLLFAVLGEINLMDHHPYAIASASVLVALDPRLSRNAMELKINTISLVIFLDIEDIFTCYNIMKQLEVEKTKVPNSPVSPNTSPVDVFHNAQASSSLSSKRKRLTFDDSGDHDDLCEKRRSC